MKIIKKEKKKKEKKEKKKKIILYMTHSINFKNSISLSIIC